MTTILIKYFISDDTVCTLDGLRRSFLKCHTVISESIMYMYIYTSRHVETWINYSNGLFQYFRNNFISERRFNKFCLLKNKYLPFKLKIVHLVSPSSLFVYICIIFKYKNPYYTLCLTINKNYDCTVLVILKTILKIRHCVHK